MTDPAPLTVVVDATNCVGSVPDGWWRDRIGATRRLRDSLDPDELRQTLQLEDPPSLVLGRLPSRRVDGCHSVMDRSRGMLAQTAAVYAGSNIAWKPPVCQKSTGPLRFPLRARSMIAATAFAV